MANKYFFSIKTPLAATTPGLPVAKKDALLKDVLNNGVRFLFDLSFGFCYPGGALPSRPAPGNPANGALVADIAEIANGAFTLGSGQTVTYAGGGFDYTSLTAPGSAIIGPASIAADIHTAFGGNSGYYLNCVYVKLPLLADWNTGGIASFLNFADVNYLNELGAIGQFYTGGQIVNYRSTGGVNVEYTLLTPNSLDYGNFAQIAFWRNASGRGLTLRTANGRVTTLNATALANADDYSTATLKVGCKGGNWNASFTNQTGAHKFRTYRAFVENLARSGRDPLTVLEADWLRIVARGDFT